MTTLDDVLADVHGIGKDGSALELHPNVVANRATTLRVLAFVNHANMGVYRDAIKNLQEGKTSTPDITAHPLQTRMKYGFGVNWSSKSPIRCGPSAGLAGTRVSMSTTHFAWPGCALKIYSAMASRRSV